MRVTIRGSNPAAVSLRGLLESTGRYVVDPRFGSQFTVDLIELDVEDIIVDGVDSAFEARIVSFITELTPKGRVLLQRQGGNQDDRAIVITFPPDDTHRLAVERGVFRALEHMLHHRPAPSRWRQRLGLGLVLGLLTGGVAEAQYFEILFRRVPFASLGTPADSRAYYCTDCVAGSAPCTGGGTGAFAFRQGASWVCLTDMPTPGPLGPYVLGDTLYASGPATLAKLAGNITTTRKFLQQTGTGLISAAPAWDTILAADVPASALSKSDDTNVTLTLGGAPTTALLAATSLSLGWSGQLSVPRGGLAKSSIAAFSLLYASAADTYAELAANTTTTRKFVQMTGTGAAGQAPVWDTVTKTDVGLSAVENTALSTWAGSANLTTLGTIASGVWNGTDIALANLTQIATATVLGRNTALTGDIEVLTALPTAVQDNITRLGTVTLGAFPAANLSGTALPAAVVSSSLTSVATIASGVWQGTDIAAGYLADTTVTPAAYGSATAIPTFTVDQQGRLTAAGSATPQLTLSSTYFSSLSAANLTSLPAANLLIASQAVGDLLYASSASVWARLADVALNQVLVSGGIGVAPAYSGTPTITGLTTTGVAALTTAAESWVGPSSTTGIYFKSGGVGIGAAGNTSSLNIQKSSGDLLELVNVTAAGQTNLYLQSKQTGGAVRYFTIVHKADDATNGALYFIPNTSTIASAVLAVQSGGNVGIGTTGPVIKLQVYRNDAKGSLASFQNDFAAAYTDALPNGDIYLDSKYTSGAIANTARIKWGLVGLYTNGGGRFGIDVITAGGTWGNVLTAQGNGNVGIGTTAPGNLLHVYKNQSATTFGQVENITADGAAAFYVKADSAQLQFGAYGTTHAAYGAIGAGETWIYANKSLTLMADTAAGVIKFATGGSAERVRIDASGNLLALVGLHVGGTSDPGDNNALIDGTLGVTGIPTFADDDMSIGGVAYKWPANNGDLNQVLGTDGAGILTWVDQSGTGGTGITSLGGLTATAQFFGNDTNVQISSSVATHTLAWAGTLAMSRGGSAKALTASAGGIVWTDADSMEVLAGTATANQMLQSGASLTPAWSTATWPATTTANQLLYSSAANTVAGLATANSGVLVTSGAGVPSIATDIPTAVTIGSAYVYRASGTDVPLADGGTNASLTAADGAIPYSTASAIALLAPGTTGQLFRSGGAGAPTWTTSTWPTLSPGAGTYLRGDGTNWITSTLILPNAATQGDIVVATGANTWGAVTAATAGKVLQAGGASTVPAYSTATYPATATTTGGYLRADGTNWITSTLLLPNAATANRVVYASATNTYGEDADLTFDGTNVGIGIATATRPLSFANTTAEKISLYAQSAAARDYYGFAIEGGILAAQVPTGQAHVSYVGSTAASTLNGSSLRVLSVTDTLLDGLRSPITQIVRPLATAPGTGNPRTANTGISTNLWLGTYLDSEIGSGNPGPYDVVSAFQLITTPNHAAEANGAYDYSIWAWNSSLMRYGPDRGSLYGYEMDIHTLYPAATAVFPGNNSGSAPFYGTSLVGHVTGFGAVLVTGADHYDGSAAFFATVAGVDAAGEAARWRYGLLVAGAKDYGVYIGGRTNNTTGEDTNGNGTTGINSDPEAAYFNDTDAATLLKSVGDHATAIITTPSFSVTRSIITLADRANGAGNAAQYIQIGRNTSGGGAPGAVGLNDKTGVQNFLWTDTTGKLRIRPTSPVPEGTADTVGTVVGDQTSSLDSKTLLGPFVDYDEALAEILSTPLHRFTYRSGAYGGQEFVGLVTDFSPIFGKDRDAAHPGGKALNEITLHGYEIAAIKALEARIRQLEAKLRM